MELDTVVLELAVAITVIAPELHRSATGKHDDDYDTCKNPYCKLAQTVLAHSQDWHRRITYEDAQLLAGIKQHKVHNK